MSLSSRLLPLSRMHQTLSLPKLRPGRNTKRLFSSTFSRPTGADFTHAVIGGGVVGLAIARQLQMREGVSTVLIERHGMVGTETSSRNSEVIHAGLYYGTSSLKKHLCITGKQMLYTLCKTHNIPHTNTGKWIVAQNAQQLSALENMHSLSKEIEVPTQFLSKQEAARREPDVRAEAGVLESPTTGIVDSHSLMQFLEGDFENRGGIIAFQSNVTDIKGLDSGRKGWEISTSSSSSSTDTDTLETTTITSETLINAAGLSAIPISNMVLPTHRHKTPHYAKGTYYSYPLSHPRPRTLIYPAPVPGHGGLGTHLTLDLSGAIRFGPDVEWIVNADPTKLDYSPNPANLAAALEDIRAYLPGIEPAAVNLDYVGIRPKLGGEGSGSHDFWIKKEEGFEGFVNLLGIESPGLTSCLAIGEMVEGLLYR